MPSSRLHDAQLLVARLNDYQAMVDNLTATQQRCNELLEESRQKGRQIARLEDELARLRTQLWEASEAG